MVRIIKWLLCGTLLLSLLGLVVAAIIYMILLRSIPAESGFSEIDGLEEEVRVVFDQEGIPHIEAQSQMAAARVMGIVHARDRLWQMEVQRMAGQGRLSEMFGSATLESDVFLRTLNMTESAKQSFDNLRPETRAILEAYVAGVNSYMRRKTRAFESSLPPEFSIVEHTPEPWEAWQGGLVVKVMALTLDQNIGYEIQRLALAARGFTPREIEDVVPYGPKENPPPLPDLRELYGFSISGKQSAKIEVFERTEDRLEKAFMWPTGQSASNNWVISGARTISGKPILANDPHLGLTAPSVFYLAHVSFQHDGEQRHVIGASLPGTPLILAGRNDRLAWGLTTTGLDAQDLYVEQINPDNPEVYRTEFGWRRFLESEETIQVSGEEPYVFTRRETRHGPVLPDSYRNLKRILPDDHVAALKWAALTPDDTTLDAAIDISLSKSTGDFVEAARAIVSPMQSMVVGDVDGNIALVAPGRAPVRHQDNLVHGRAPVLGWEPVYEWQGYIPFDELPQITNPSSGALATANANFLPDDYSRHITHDWAEHFRQDRVEQLVIEADQKHNVAASREIMADTYSDAMIRLRNIAFQTMTTSGGSGDELLAALQAWDGRMDADRPEPLIMLAWFRHLHRAILADELGEFYEYFEKGKVTVLLRLLETSGVRNWCDRFRTTADEDCSEILRDALDEAINELTELHGNDWQKWRYGAAHIAYGEHRPFARIGVLASLFSIEVPSAGGPYTLMRGQTDFSKAQPYHSRSASAYRAIYDLDNMDSSIFIQSTGQSGHFLSRFYRNFSERWARNEFITMTTKKNEYENQAAGIWVFKPMISKELQAQ